jgi:hypothetical protein
LSYSPLKDVLTSTNYIVGCSLHRRDRL